MRKLIVLSISVLYLSCLGPDPVRFDAETRMEPLIGLNGEKASLGEVMDGLKGKTYVIDVWASWCADCIKGMPDLKKLQKTFPDVPFLFLSVDRSQASWKRAIMKYDIEGEHYFLPNAQSGALNNFLKSNWIPRYLVINPDGSIKLFKAKRASDPALKQSLE